MQASVTEIEKFNPDWIRPGEDINVLVGACSELQIEQMFGPTSEVDLFVEVCRNKSWPMLLVELGCYQTPALAMKSFCLKKKKSPRIATGFHQENAWTSGPEPQMFSICLFKPPKEYEEEGPQ